MDEPRAGGRASSEAGACPADVEALGPREVHVWRILGADAKPSSALARRLSREERSRADAFASPRHRHRFVTCRAALRTLLGRYLGCEPQQIELVRGVHGKPGLRQECNQRGLSFNVSHSGAVGLVALSIGRELGVDVERIRPEFAVDRVAARYFGSDERAMLRRSPAELRPERFFALWTRREAIGKATGEGLARALVRGPRSTRFAGQARGVPFQVRDLDVGGAYRAALAVEGGGWTLRRRDWPAAPWPEAAPRGKVSRPGGGRGIIP